MFNNLSGSTLERFIPTAVVFGRPTQASANKAVKSTALYSPEGKRTSLQIQSRKPVECSGQIQTYKMMKLTPGSNAEWEEDAKALEEHIISNLKTSRKTFFPNVKDEEWMDGVFVDESFQSIYKEIHTEKGSYDGGITCNWYDSPQIYRKDGKTKAYMTDLKGAGVIPLLSFIGLRFSTNEFGVTKISPEFIVNQLVIVYDKEELDMYKARNMTCSVVLEDSDSEEVRPVKRARK